MPTRAITQAETAEQAVREANRRFYEAFAALDLERMDQVWSHEDSVVCVHPGWDLLLGWEEVRESWARIFSSTQRMKVEISSVWVRVEGDVAWVACTEHVTTTFEGGFDQALVQATNIFLRRPMQPEPQPGSSDAPSKNRERLRWCVVARHASPLPSSPAPLQ
jgi:ketosteroid isomerase-like protein